MTNQTAAAQIAALREALSNLAIIVNETEHCVPGMAGDELREHLATAFKTLGVE